MSNYKQENPGEFTFRHEGEETDYCDLTIPLPNGVHVKISNEDFTNPHPRVRAYVSRDGEPNLHFREDCPGNRELTGADFVALLNWAMTL
jgi:hypothetical protein